MTWGWNWLRTLLASRCDWLGHKTPVVSERKASRRIVGRKLLTAVQWIETCPRCRKGWRCHYTEGLVPGRPRITREEVPTW